MHHNKLRSLERVFLESRSYLTIIHRTWLCVCLSLNYSFIFTPFVTKWTPDRYGRGNFNEGVDWGPRSLGPQESKMLNNAMTTKLGLKNP